jgi:DnaK suppressor protein
MLPVDKRVAHELLESRRRELGDELRRLTAPPRDPLAAVSFGKRVGDGTTEAVERISTTAVAQRLSAMASQIDRALEKLDAGVFGTCENCGALIPDERLEAVPWTPYCVSCSNSRSGSDR